MSDNMRIWDAVCEVDEKFTEPIKDGRGLTAIVPMYLIRQATEMWGPMGEGWGFEIEKEGHIFHNNSKRPEDALHTMTIKLWYGEAAMQLSPPCTKATYGVGCTKMFRYSGGEYYIDPDYNKSTLTDAITNALSRLGFGGSVRLKEYQSKYTTNLDARDTEVEKAWDKYVTFRRSGPADASDKSTATLMQQGVEELKANSRNPQNPDHILAMIKETG